MATKGSNWALCLRHTSSIASVYTLWQYFAPLQQNRKAVARAPTEARAQVGVVLTLDVAAWLEYASHCGIRINRTTSAQAHRLCCIGNIEHTLLSRAIASPSSDVVSTSKQ